MTVVAPVGESAKVASIALLRDQRSSSLGECKPKVATMNWISPKSENIKGPRSRVLLRNLSMEWNGCKSLSRPTSNGPNLKRHITIQRKSTGISCVYIAKRWNKRGGITKVRKCTSTSHMDYGWSFLKRSDVIWYGVGWVIFLRWYLFVEFSVLFFGAEATGGFRLSTPRCLLSGDWSYHLLTLSRSATTYWCMYHPFLSFFFSPQ